MNLRIHEDSNVIRIDVLGALDAEAALNAQHAVKDVITSAASTVTIDFSEVEFIDPSGIGMIVFLFKRLSAAGRRLHIVGVQGQPERLIRKLGLDGPLYVSFKTRPLSGGAGVVLGQETRAS